jgi:zeaxanthin epoxidase
VRSTTWPPQIQSNALAALEAIDPAVADEVMRNGCITGDRINGLCDGVTGEWQVLLGGRFALSEVGH